MGRTAPRTALACQDLSLSSAGGENEFVLLTEYRLQEYSALTQRRRERLPLVEFTRSPDR